MFGKDTQLKASRPTKRMTAQDMDDEHVIAAGALHRKDLDAVPHQRIPGWLDSHSASDALNFDSTSEVCYILPGHSFSLSNAALTCQPLRYIVDNSCTQLSTFLL
jgi:hypothetical protein